MRTIFMLVLSCTCFLINGQSIHGDPTHNFSVQRVLILNDKEEMLMVREKHVWAPISFVFDNRKFLKESIDSLGNAYGLEIRDIELRGQFYYKYDYHPYATMRNFYVAKHAGGEVTVPRQMDEVKWLAISKAIELNSVPAIKQIVNQIVKYPNIVWGGSFMVSHIEDDHPTKMVEPFYPLFE